MNAETTKYEEARRQVRRKARRMTGFYTHLGVYVLVNAMLILINLTTTPNALWFYWPLAGWGIGLASHALSIFIYGSMYGADWEERQIKDLMDQA